MGTRSGDSGERFHEYFNPGRGIEAGALAVHGISEEFLEDKPPFEEVGEEFLRFIDGAELVIHNAPFDVGFMDHEFALLGKKKWGQVSDHCGVLDTLAMARKLHPGQKNNLDALCRRYSIDNTHRELHGALLDAEILADVYLTMTGGQAALSLGGHDENHGTAETGQALRRLAADRPPLPVLRADEAELEAHQARLEAIAKASGGRCVWGAEEG